MNDFCPRMCNTGLLRIVEIDRTSTFGGFGLSQTLIHFEKTETTSNWTISIDQETGTMSKVVNTGPMYLKANQPLIYQKMVEAGDIPPGP